ncbi:hypothetical protein A3Q56_04367 [Intoshia linei]|uniref:Pyruvate carboxylase n=1 Tax=Intoshia linei TaxID=1819745 RepID=A0A177B0U6_9BILA|nr:hypothetical protein A3Q56_04367 [Intoshia linei]
MLRRKNPLYFLFNSGYKCKKSQNISNSILFKNEIFYGKKYKRCFSASPLKNIKTILVANRGEIAIRIFRAANEMSIKTVGIYSEADLNQSHRVKADESYLVGKNLNPVAAYLSAEEIIKIAKDRNVDAIHPGYGFLSESAEFASKCIDNDLIFVGPTPKTLLAMGEKVAARQIAIDSGVPVIPGTSVAVKSLNDITEFGGKYGYPIILKAAHGGGGKGMRVIFKDDIEEIETNFQSATNEALNSFGNGDLFIEKYIKNPRHIEIQILGDKQGNVVHLHERDCSVQRRHQKVIEIAPAPHLDSKLKKIMTEQAIRIAKRVNYENAGTVEFLVDEEGNHFFIEVNPRLQVEHTVTEEITGIDLVQSQINIADGLLLKDLSLIQNNININGSAIQCRLTTEDSTKNFQPNAGILEVFRYGLGMGIRLDGASSYSGCRITSHYDSLLLKIISKAKNHEMACQKMIRAINETRIRGVKTNIPFLLNVLKNEQFIKGNVRTNFIDDNPDLLIPQLQKNRAQKLIKFIVNTSVNGPPLSLATDLKSPKIEPKILTMDHQRYLVSKKTTKNWRYTLKEHGMKNFLKKIRQEKKILITDTTMRDAHQSLLATRVRTFDLLKIAPFVSQNMGELFSLENWGGATFDVAYRFLHEDPWMRLTKLRELIPNIPFQMLIRGSSAVGYSNYPDNVVERFCEESYNYGIDIFRIFDALNYMPNMIFGIEACGKTGGVVEAAISFTGDILDKSPNNRYNLEYYINLAKQIVEAGTHILCIKDMAGILRPESSKILFTELRNTFPDIPLHYHTHDTACVGLINCLIASECGVDIIDLAIDSMSGLTSQPCMGSFIKCLSDTDRKTDFNLNVLHAYSNYWEQARQLYAPFECCTTLKSGTSEAFDHEIPGGQYTNLHFQAHSLGLSKNFDKIKKAYMIANKLLMDVPKVTPISKVVGDLAQFMVNNNLMTEKDVLKQAHTLSFPDSLFQFMKGEMGIPPNGFNEDFRKNILKDTIVNDSVRPGVNMAPFDFEKLKEQIYIDHEFAAKKSDLVSCALYPSVYNEYLEYYKKYGPVCLLDTRSFFFGLEEGESIEIELEKGKMLQVQMLSKGITDSTGNIECFVRLNGETRCITIPNLKDKKISTKRAKAIKGDPFSIGAIMPGDILSINVSEGDVVRKGKKLLTISAMKMENSITCPVDEAIVEKINIVKNSNVESGDLLIQLRSTDKN